MGILALAVTQRADLLIFADILVPAFFTGTIGLVILLRSPNYRMGWLLIAIGIWGTLLGFSGQYAELVFLKDPAGAYPLKWVSAWVANWGWFPFLGMVFMILPQIFPTGHPLPHRWKTVLQVTLIYIVLFTLLLAFGNVPLAVSDVMLPNPVGVIPIDELVDATVPDAIITALLLGSLIISWISLAVRYRRSRGNERQQMKWITFALGVLVALFVTDSTLSIVLEGDCCGTDTLGPVFDLLGVLAFLGLPAAIGISILRYRLYDIDRIIRRTLSYTILTVILAITYFGGVLLFQRILPTQSQFAIVLSTLTIAALFSPLRRRIQTSIDERFYRNRYDPQKALVAFSADLRKQLDSDEITKSMLDFIEETVKPTHASVWIRHPG